MALEEGLNQLYGKTKQHPLTSLSILIILLFFLLTVIPYLQIYVYDINNDTVNATLENQYRATLAQILGGVAIGIGLYYTWRRISIAEEDLKVTQENLKVAQDNLKVTQENLEATQKAVQENLKVAQEGQITERFTRAIDQLGNPAIEIRLGGIYALERIANESEKDYWPIMEILSAYVRMNSRINESLYKSSQIVTPISMDFQADEIIPKEAQKAKKVSLDIQVVLTVLGRRKNTYENGESKRLNLNETCLEGIDLNEAHLEGAYFWNAQLNSASLRSSHLEKSKLLGTDLIRADLTGADIKKAELLFATCNDVVLEGANLEGAEIVGTVLEGANLRKANLKEATLSSSTLTWADLKEANFEGTILTDTDLKGANLKGVKNLTADQLSKANTLYNANLDSELKEELRSKGYSHLLDDEPRLNPYAII